MKRCKWILICAMFAFRASLSFAAEGVCFNFEDVDSLGHPVGWARFNESGAGIDWSGSSTSFCDGGATQNWTSQIGAFACFFTPDTAVGLGMDGYLCSPEIQLSSAAQREIEVNIEFGSRTGSQDNTFSVLFGDAEPTLASIAGYETLYLREGSLGLGSPGIVVESITLPDTAASGYVCFRFQSGWDGFAAIDNFQTAPPSCPASEIDSDGDTVSDAVDNCLLMSNIGQEDTNADGFGNACDADLSNDCLVNAIDLGIFRTQFFMTGPNDADFNSDGVVAAVDLGVLRALFFELPGPSALSSCPD